MQGLGEEEEEIKYTITSKKAEEAPGKIQHPFLILKKSSLG